MSVKKETTLQSVEELRKNFAGPMSEDEIEFLQDVTGFESRLTAVYEICRDAVERELFKYQPTRQSHVTSENHGPPEISAPDEADLRTEVPAD